MIRNQDVWSVRRTSCPLGRLTHAESERHVPQLAVEVLPLVHICCAVYKWPAWTCLAQRILTWRVPLLQALLKEGDAGLLPTVMEAYARPTRIVRGKDVSPEWVVDEGRFEMDEEHALWAAFQSTRKAVHPAMGIREFLEASNFVRSITVWPGATRSARSNFARAGPMHHTDNQPGAVHCILTSSCMQVEIVSYSDVIGQARVCIRVHASLGSCRIQASCRMARLSLS